VIVVHIAVTDHELYIVEKLDHVLSCHIYQLIFVSVEALRSKLAVQLFKNQVFAGKDNTGVVGAIVSWITAYETSDHGISTYHGFKTNPLTRTIPSGKLRV